MKSKKFYYIQNYSEKITVEQVDAALEEEYFEEVMFSFELLIPVVGADENEFLELSFSYIFEVFKGTGNIEVCFNEENEPNINLISYIIDEKALNNIVKAESIDEISFKEFVINSKNTILETLNNISIKNIFQVPPKNTFFDESLKKELIKNFSKEIDKFLFHVENKNKAYKSIESEDILKLKGTIKKLDSISEFNDLRNELKDKKEIRKIKI